MTTNEKTMTTREFYNAIIAKLEGQEVDVTDVELSEFAQAQLAKMDETNAKRKGRVDKAAQERAAANAPMMDTLEAALTDEPQTATDMMELIGQTVQKTSHLLRDLVAQERAVVQDIKVKGKGTQKGYTKVIKD